MEEENLRLSKLIKHHQEESIFLNDTILDFLEMNKELSNSKNIISFLQDELDKLNNNFNYLKIRHENLSKKNVELKDINRKNMIKIKNLENNLKSHRKNKETTNILKKFFLRNK